MSRQIPTITLPGGGKLPKLYMGAGDFTAWLKAAGKGAGVKTAYGEHLGEIHRVQLSSVTSRNHLSNGPPPRAARHGLLVYHTDTRHCTIVCCVPPSGTRLPRLSLPALVP